MYNLRTIFKFGDETVKELGNSYSLIRKTGNRKQFNTLLEQIFDQTDPEVIGGTRNKVWGIITTNQETIPLYPEEKYYIMTESGNTFSHPTPNWACIQNTRGQYDIVDHLYALYFGNPFNERTKYDLLGSLNEIKHNRSVHSQEIVDSLIKITQQHLDRGIRDSQFILSDLINEMDWI